jgi:hypothetical protein
VAWLQRNKIYIIEDNKPAEGVSYLTTGPIRNLMRILPRYQHWVAAPAGHWVRQVTLGCHLASWPLLLLLLGCHHVVLLAAAAAAAAGPVWSA